MKWKLPTLSRSQRLLCMLSLTASYFVVELVVGLTTNSLALVADSFHMASDVLALIVALASIRIGQSESTPRYSYGFERAELIGALANGVFLLGLCFTIAVDAIGRTFRPEVIEQPKLVLIVGLVGLAINFIGLLLFAGAGHVHHGHAHSHGHGRGHETSLKCDNGVVSKTTEPCHVGVDCNDHHDHGSNEGETAEGHAEHANDGHETQCDGYSSEEGSNTESATTKQQRRVKNSSLNMRAVLLHVAGDALGSLVVVFTAIAIWKGNLSFFDKYLDPIASLIIVLILGYASLPLVLQASSVLLNATPLSVDPEALHDAVTALPGVLGVHELHVWQLSDLKLVASVHIRISRCCSFMVVGTGVKEVFHAAGVHSVTIQPEFVSAEAEAAIGMSAAPNAEDRIAEGHQSSFLPLDNDCLLRCDGVACEQMMCCRTPLRAVQIAQTPPPVRDFGGA